jgi:hypothetical protein
MLKPRMSSMAMAHPAMTTPTPVNTRTRRRFERLSCVTTPAGGAGFGGTGPGGAGFGGTGPCAIPGGTGPGGTGPGGEAGGGYDMRPA